MNRRWRLAQWAEIRWWKRYLGKKSPEDYLAWKAAYWNAFLERLDIRVRPGSRVLDAGCGPAGIFMVLPAARVDAIDPQLSAYGQLPHFQQGRYPWVSFYESMLEDFDPGYVYDSIFCLNVLNHTADVPQSIIRLYQGLKPGGSLFISVDAHKLKLPKWLFSAIPLDVLHPFQEDLTGYRMLFQIAGFKEMNAVCYEKGNIFDYWVLHLQK